MTAAEWQHARLSVIGEAMKLCPGWTPTPGEQEFIDACVAEILERESAVQAAMDLQVKRILGLGIPVERCVITACTEPCDEPLTTLGYAHAPHGYLTAGFLAYRKCPKHTAYWTELF